VSAWLPHVLWREARPRRHAARPLCPECYDYTGAVLFNTFAPELWRRFTITLRRSLARQAGLTNKALAGHLRVSYAKVAEYQQRGVVHFHAITRLDGPAGPTTAPPAWATLALLTAAISQAASAVHVDTSTAPGLAARPRSSAIGRSAPRVLDRILDRGVHCSDNAVGSW
jgi:replication initiator protein RepSA